MNIKGSFDKEGNLKKIKKTERFGMEYMIKVEVMLKFYFSIKGSRPTDLKS